MRTTLLKAYILLSCTRFCYDNSFCASNSKQLTSVNAEALIM